MNRHIAAMIGLSAGMGVAAPASAQAQQLATFRVGGVAYEITLPKGFCTPQGRAVDAAQLAAAADADNITDLSVFPCGDDGTAANYFLVKTPKNLITAAVTREEVLASAGAEFDKPEFAELLASGKINQNTAKAYTDLTRQVTTLTGQVTPLGRDETCAYLGGVLSFKTEQISYSRAVAGCITAVAGRVIFVYRYSEGDPANVAKMLPVTKSFALSLSGKPAQ